MTQLTKQKETNEKCLRTQIARLKLENDKLYDRLEKKSGMTGSGLTTKKISIKRLCLYILLILLYGYTDYLIYIHILGLLVSI